MNEFSRSKVTGSRWVKKPLEDIQIKIKLKVHDGVVSLPKFEDYTNESSRFSGVSYNHTDKKIKEFTFKWQEKVFSIWELQRYSDIHNCISQTELNYNEMIKDMDYEPSKVFTYIHEDYHLPLPVENKIKEARSNIDDLSCCFKNTSLNYKLGQLMCVFRDTSSMGHLFRSMENIESKDQWTAMHIVLDNSEYNEDSQLLLKQEAKLLSLYYNNINNCLMISPDVNSLELNPYTVETASGHSLDYHYSVDIQFEEEDSGDELVMLLQKLYKKWERRQKQLINFETPPLGKKQYFITIELLSAAEFDMNNLYIEFHIKLPEGIQCHESLHGRTHVTTSVQGDREVWNFGHIIDCTLEMEAGSDSTPIQLFFEVISTDWWGRHRTEGYTYLPLSLTAGRFSKTLSCARPDEKDSTEADSRRFFIGGCNLIKNLDVLANPQLLNANFKFVSTGNLNLRWNVISQASLPGSLPKPASQGATSASALLLGAEAVLRQYRKARARLAIATEGLAKGEPVA